MIGLIIDLSMKLEKTNWMVVNILNKKKVQMTLEGWICEKKIPKILQKQEKSNILKKNLTSTSLYLPKNLLSLKMPGGKMLDFIFVDGQICCFLLQLAEILDEDYAITLRLFNEGCRDILAPEYFGISLKKRITKRRLIRDFNMKHFIQKHLEHASYVLLKEDDLIYLTSRFTSNKAKLILKFFINHFYKAKRWICDLIYKLGKCNNREFLFLCAWLRLGWALEEIIPQRWYKLPTTTRRVDFRLHQGEILVEIDAGDIKLHDPHRDKSTDRLFLEKGKLLVRFMNEEIDQNPLKCVRQLIKIMNSHGIIVKQEILPLYIQGFKVRKSL